MVDQIIRPADLATERTNPVPSEFMVSDNGSTVAKVTIENVVLAGRPTASQAEAEAGVNSVKAMTPLTTKQAVDAQVPSKITDAINALNLGTAAQADVVDFATAAQGTTADTAVQPGDLATVATTGSYNDLIDQPDFQSTSVESRSWAIANFHPISAPSFLETAGYSSPGDGGGALYKNVVSEPSHAGKFSITLAVSGTIVWYEIAQLQLAPEMFGAVGDNSTDDGPAFRAALSFGRSIYPMDKIYVISGTLQFGVGGIIGVGRPTSGPGTGRTMLRFKDIAANSRAIYIYDPVLSGGDAHIEDLYIQAQSWDPTSGALGYGIEVIQLCRINNVTVDRFKKSNIFIHWTALDANHRAPYGCIWENVRSTFSGEHGWVLGTGAGLQKLINCEAKWNGATTFGVAPGAAGNFDGIYINAAGDGNPGNVFPSFNVESPIIVGGDFSYNSRHGANILGVTNADIVVGYSEGNLAAGSKQINIGNGVFGSLIDILTVAGGSSGVTFGASSSGGGGGPSGPNYNQVRVNGQNFGQGDSIRTQYILGRNISYVGYNEDRTNFTTIRGSEGTVDGKGSLQSAGSAYWNFTGNPVRFADTQIFGPRKTGWSAATGTATRTTFATGSVTLPQLAERLKALIDDLTSHGLIGP